jgi:hypothetical protein
MQAARAEEGLMAGVPGQIDFYDDAKLIAASADAVASWFRAQAGRNDVR